MTNDKPFLKVETPTGGLAIIALDTVVAIKDWAIEGNLCCQITYMAGDIPNLVHTSATAAEVWDQVLRLRAGFVRVEDTV